MSTFEKALAFTLQWEGGYVNDPDDPGGATNKGITQKTYDAWLKEKGRASAPVKNIPDAEVSAIYQGSYWAKAHCPEIPGVAAQAAFDIAVNMGVGRAVKLVQAGAGVTADGAWGPNTAAAVGKQDGIALARALCDARDQYYKDLATKNPTLKKFLRGWLRRVAALRTELQCGGESSEVSFDVPEPEFTPRCPEE